MKTEYKYLAGGIAILLISFLFIGDTLFQILQPGLTVNSISTTQVISTDADLAGTWFLVDTTLGGGQSIVGTITPEEFEQLSGYETEYPLEINVITSDEIARYNIKNDLVGVYDYSYEVLEPTSLFPVHIFPDCSGDAYAAWRISNEDRAWWDLFSPLSLKVCVYKELKGVKGHIEQTSTPFSADISLTVHGNTVTKTVSSTETAVNFYDGSDLLATAQWTGSLVTGDIAPNPSPFVSIWKEGTSTWSVIKKDMYDAYLIEKESADNMLLECNKIPTPETCPLTLTQLNERLTEIRAYSTYLLTANDIGELNPSATIINQGTDGSYLDIPLDTRITVPKILFKIRASWIGVKIETARPLITTISCPSFESGTEGTLNFNVKNIGGTTGTFVATLVDCGVIQPKYSSQPLGQILAGETISVNMPIILQEQAAAGSETCRVKVYDYNNPANANELNVKCYWTVPTLPTCNFNDVCETSLGETIENCPDCGSPSPVGDGDDIAPIPGLEIPLNIIFSVLIGAGIFFFTGNKELMAKRKNYPMIFTYLLLGIGVGLISWLILENIVLILIGLGVASILGGVALYVAGGAIITIVGTLMIIMKKVSGGKK